MLPDLEFYFRPYPLHEHSVLRIALYHYQYQTILYA